MPPAGIMSRMPCFQSLQEYPKHSTPFALGWLLVRFQSLQEYPKRSYLYLPSFPQFVSNPYRNILSFAEIVSQISSMYWFPILTGIS